jgi:hypothetical protein
MASDFSAVLIYELIALYWVVHVGADERMRC